MSVEDGDFIASTTLAAGVLDLWRRFPEQDEARCAQIQELLLQRTDLAERQARNLAARVDQALGKVQTSDEDPLLAGLVLLVAGHAEKYIYSWVEFEQLEGRARRPVEKSMAAHRNSIAAELRALYRCGCPEISRHIEEMDTLMHRMVMILKPPRLDVDRANHRLGLMALLFYELRAGIINTVAA